MTEDHIKIVGPPTLGPKVSVHGNGIDIFIRVNDEIDSEIVRIAILIAERRRYGRSN